MSPPPHPPQPHQWDLARVKLKRNLKNINLYLSATLNGFFGDDETELRISTGLEQTRKLFTEVWPRS